VLRQDTNVNLSVFSDVDKRGAAHARDMALRGAATEWVAFLDDDDEMDSYHVRKLLECAREFGADYVWSRFRIATPAPRNLMSRDPSTPRYDFRDGPYPLGAGTFEQWNDEQPAQTTVTTLVRRELALDVGGFRNLTADGYTNVEEIDGQRAGEDWSFTLRCRAAAGLSGMRHHPEVTWTWHHHESNTSGLPSRW
jgi:hypothetical protein